MTRQYSDTSSVASGNVVRIICIVQFYFGVRHRIVIVVVIQRLHIRLTTTAKDVIDRHASTFYFQQQTFWTGHTSLITTTIEVADPTFLQIPSRTDGHVSLIVTTKQSTNLVGITAGVGEGSVNAHLFFEAVVGQQLASVISIRIGCIYDSIHHFTGVIHTDNSSLRYCSIVTATIGIDDGTAVNVNEGLTKVRDSEWCTTGSHFFIILYGIILLFDDGLLAFNCSNIPFPVFIFAVATTEELANINLLVGIFYITFRNIAISTYLKIMFCIISSSFVCCISI